MGNTTPPARSTHPPGAVVIVPARLESVRMPGKVLADRTGMPLVQHVVERARGASCVSRVVVAADSDRIVGALAPFGTETVMTDPAHENGTSRLAEAARLLGLDDETVVVNAQGDEPELDPGAIDDAVRALVESGADMATAAAPFGPGEDPADPSAVKVVLARDGAALYFSRAPIPHNRDGGEPACAPLRHIGLYAYRRSFLERYAAMAPTPLERTERLEQLRALELGARIAVAVRESEGEGEGIDTPEQYERFVQRWLARGARPI